MNVWLRRSGALASAVLGVPVGALALALRPAWRIGLRERLGAFEARDQAGGVWLHAASLGELRAASALVPGLRAAGLPIAVSTSTLSARSQIEPRCGAVASGLMPLDHPWAVDRALQRVAPRALVLVETELWPIWIAAAERRGTAVVVVSGRLSDRNFARLQRAKAWIAPTLGRLRAVGARGQEDAERFAALGVEEKRIQVTGDLKLTMSDPAKLPGSEDLDAFIEASTGEELWVAGSIHSGEFDAILDALDQVEASGRALRLLIAPRHLEDVAELERAIEKRGRPALRRRRWKAGERARMHGRAVIVLDTHGELERLYGHAAHAFVGGSLVPVGGHDLLEALAGNTPVLFGPHTENQRAARELLLENGAGREVANALELGHALIESLARDDRSDDGLVRARRALEAHRASADRSVELILTQLAHDLPGPAPRRALR